jgi:hypothetical protein
MNFRVTLCALLAFALTGCSSSNGLYRWVPFVGKGKKGEVAEVEKIKKSDPFGPVTGPVVYGLELRAQVQPQPVKLADTRSLEVHIQLINRTKKPVSLRFADSKHFDLILRDASGKKLAQWSDDQPVVSNPGIVIIDPSERAEFIGNVSTRDMASGRNYSVDAIVVGYDSLRQTISLTPIK